MSTDVDAWFAKTDDILTDWQGDVDAMRYLPGEGAEPEAELADSYYQQSGMYNDDLWHMQVPFGQTHCPCRD